MAFDLSDFFSLLFCCWTIYLSSDNQENQEKQDFSKNFFLSFSHRGSILLHSYVGCSSYHIWCLIRKSHFSAYSTTMNASGRTCTSYEFLVINYLVFSLFFSHFTFILWDHTTKWDYCWQYDSLSTLYRAHTGSYSLRSGQIQIRSYCL